MTVIRKFTALGGLLALPGLAFGDLPWLPAPGANILGFTFVHEWETEVFTPTKKSPFLGRYEQESYLFSYQRGITDRVAIDATAGYSTRSFRPQSGLPADTHIHALDHDGAIDPRFGIRYRVWDEFEDGGVTTTLRFGGFVGGGYRPGGMGPIGQNASGFEFSPIIGKLFDSGLGLSTQAGYRVRDSKWPNQWFINADVLYGLDALTPGLTAHAAYNFVASEKGRFDFSPAEPSGEEETEEHEQIFFATDYSQLSGGLAYRITKDVAADVSYGGIVDGRNIGLRQFVSFSLSGQF